MLSGNLEDFKDPLLLADKRSTYKYDYTHRDLGDFRLTGDDQENWKAEYAMSGSAWRPEIGANLDSDGHYGGRVGNQKSPGNNWQVQYDTKQGLRADVAAKTQMGDLNAAYAARASVGNSKNFDISLDQEGLVEYMVADNASLFARASGNVDKVKDWEVGAKYGNLDRNILHSPLATDLPGASTYGAAVAYGPRGVSGRGQISAELGNAVQAQYEVQGRVNPQGAPELLQAMNVRYEKEPGSVVFGRLEKNADKPPTLRVGYTVKN